MPATSPRSAAPKSRLGRLPLQQDHGAPECISRSPPHARASRRLSPQGTAPQPATNPAKKRKVALFLAYVGHGYQGMQRNPGARTIEEELFKALHAAGAISDANNDDHGFMKVGPPPAPAPPSACS